MELAIKRNSEKVTYKGKSRLLQAMA
jgi:hypothetical protein